MQAFTDAVNGVLWGIPMLVLIVGTGIFLSCWSGFFQIRKFGYAMKNTLGKIFKKSEAGKGEITPFQAVTTALAATVGTGNISGIIAAVTLGGPGAIFWLWVAAIFGMCTKYAEVLLAVKYRERNADGDWVGGPMYYIKNGLGKNWKWLSILFCLFGALAAFGIGCITQVNNVTDAVGTAFSTFNPDFAGGTTLNWVIGIVIAIIVGVTLIGGIKRLGKVTEKLVPFMSVIYILACLVVIIGNIGSIGAVFGAIFKYAFNPTAVIGGATGVAIKTCITWGVKRGVFSNEAGLGSAPIAHASTSETDPVKQGLYGIFEVFMDTIVICTLTGVTILIASNFTAVTIPASELEAQVQAALSSGKSISIANAATALRNSDYSQYLFVFYEKAGGVLEMVKGGNVIIASAFGTIFGNKIGSLIIAVAIALFALSTTLSWALYGSRCCEFLFKSPKCIKPYYVVFIVVVLIGAQMNSTLAWDIADMLNGFMAIPNLIAVVALSGVVMKLTKEHFADKTKLK